MGTAIVAMGAATAAVVAMATAMAATMAATMTVVAGTKTMAATVMAGDTDKNQLKGAARRLQCNVSRGSMVVASAEWRRQRGSSAAMVGNLAVVLAARGRWGSAAEALDAEKIMSISILGEERGFRSPRGKPT